MESRVFRTQIDTAAGDDMRGIIAHDRPMLMLGSCFSDEMSRRLERDGFEVTANPGGPVYNPLSMLEWIRALAEGNGDFSSRYVRGVDGMWHSWMHHTRFSSPERCVLDERIRATFIPGRLHRAATVFLTLGSTRVFMLDGRPVSNCHKFSPATFTERRLSFTETVQSIGDIESAIKAVNPQARIIWTVSPVFHPGQGGLHADAVSKATLLAALAESDVSYFPAFETLRHDLRDYRFYAADMRHPSDVAADYIYELMCDTYMTPQTIIEARRQRRDAARAAHRPLRPSDD